MKAFATLKKLFSSPNYMCEFEVLNELKNLTNRCDDNCLYHTRFLFEMDEIPLSEQYKNIQNVAKYCRRITYSGKKSLHHIIEFASEYEDQCSHLYKEIWTVLNEMFFAGNADDHCSNPARLTRRPGAIRSDNHKRQELLFTGTYLPNDIAKDVIRKAKSLHIANTMNKPSAKPHVGPKHDGMCRLYEVVTRYLNKAFPNTHGNGVSSKWLYAAMACCLKYNDMTTLALVKQKAIAEHWTEKELTRIVESLSK